MNEGVILIISSFLVTFTDDVQDGKVQYNIGWLIIGIIGMQCLINFGVAFVDTILKIVRVFREKCKGKC